MRHLVEEEDIHTFLTRCYSSRSQETRRTTCRSCSYMAWWALIIASWHSKRYLISHRFGASWSSLQVLEPLYRSRS